MWRAAGQVEVTRGVRCKKDPFAGPMVGVEARQERLHVAPIRLPAEGLQRHCVVDVLAELTWDRLAEQARRAAVSRHARLHLGETVREEQAVPLAEPRQGHSQNALGREHP